MRRPVVRAAGAALLLAACAHGPERRAEGLRRAYAEALRRDDPDAAYELLSAEARAHTSREAFRERWRASSDERASQLAGIGKLERALAAPVMSGVTTHEDGHVLYWVAADGKWLVVQGLPGFPDTSTPTATIRSLVRALRTLDVGRIDTLLDPELAARLREEWAARAQRIERALEDPRALDLAPDVRRAVLEYGPGERIILEQTSRGWRVIELE